MIQKYQYSIYGFQLESAMELPALLPSIGAPAVVCSFGRLPDFLPDANVSGFRFESAPGQFLLKVETTANFLVSGGREITVELLNGNELEKIRVILLGSVMGALCYQRELLVFHGSAVSTDAGAVLFLTHLRLGASTLAALCCESGCQLVSDSLVVLSLRDGRLMVEPSYPQIDLWEDTLAFLGDNVKNMPPVRNGMAKFSKSYSSCFSSSPSVVKKIYLISAERGREIAEIEVSGAEAIRSFLVCGYHTDFIGNAKQRQRHLQQCAEICRAIPIVKLSLPDSLDALRYFPQSLRNRL